MAEYRGSFGLVTYNHQLLLMLRDDNPDISNPNKWCFIGGRDDEGETYEQTFMREAEEEIGIRPSQAKYLQLFEIDGRRYAVFTAPLTDEEKDSIELGDEGQELKFFDWDDLESLPLAQTTKDFVEHYPEVIKSALA